MPRRGKGDETPAAKEQRVLLWGSYGKIAQPELSSWDPKQEPLIEALLTVVESGATLVLRPGSGGRALGLAIWEGDFRHPPVWVYTAAELDDWASEVIERARGRDAAD